MSQLPVPENDKHQEITKAAEGQEVDKNPPTQQIFDATSPELVDVPPALLEFYSPSAALINLPPTPAAEYMGWIISCMAIFCFLGMAIFPLDKVVTSPGKITSAEATIVVQPLDTSIIHSIDVHEGDFVHKGQVLAHLDPTISTADVEALRKQMDSYQAEVDRLIAEVQGKDYQADINNPASLQQRQTFLKRRQEFNQKVADFDHKIAELQSDLQGFLANVAMYGGRAKVAQDVTNMRLRLQQESVGSKLSTLASQDNLMEMQRSQVSAQQSANSTRDKLRSMEAQKQGYIDSFQADNYKMLAEAQHHLYEIRGNFEKADLRKKLVLMKAPQDAIVLTISKLSQGSVISTGTPLLTLVPVGSGLEVQVQVRSQDAGFIRLGDKALIKFATFPYTQYGGAEATVRNISADSFLTAGEEKPGPNGMPSSGGSPSNNQLPFYRVTLHIDHYSLHGVPEFFHPQPGMPVTADIKVGKRTIVQYFLNTVVPAATEGMREP
ncbi:HlyD family type I secretion periplasmic adaptor subunit [Entomobacter blattae]|uniref:Membrane fusion protein (MFP) family protein n=1 Tax=Entomobacter blattae TaxID=2762277 RepID=A0A7H1NQZ3_9PROT|nr:HlyD family type I secretion periplasmic adaptor subunit [Entomobacter blattae]QNT78203.1 Hemolysin secretion protein D, chromosomal [Entomobacter blattae]